MGVLRQNGVCGSSILLVCLDHNFKIYILFDFW
jgi:hypothetical protein